MEFFKKESRRLNGYADDNPLCRMRFCLPGPVCVRDVATTRYGADAFQNVYENLRSIVQCSTHNRGRAKQLPSVRQKHEQKESAQGEMGCSGVNPEEMSVLVGKKSNVSGTKP